MTTSLPKAVLEGRLDPRSVALVLLGSLLRLALPFVVLAIQAPSWIPLLVVFTAATAGIAVVDQLSYRYRLTESELVVTHGVLRRHERRIPVDRIHDVGEEQDLVRRWLGIVVVTIETASTRGAEAKLDAVSRVAADRLREAIQTAPVARPESAGVAPTARSNADDAIILHESSMAELVRRGLTHNRGGLVLLTALALVDRLSAPGDVGLLEWLGRELFAFTARQLQTDTALFVSLALALVGVVIVVGWLASALVTLYVFYGFQLRRRGDVLERRYGLVTTRRKSIPIRRVQVLRIERTLLGRFVGLADVRADQAGTAVDRDAERTGTHVFIPAVPLSKLDELIAGIFERVDLAAVRWQSVSPRMIRRFIFLGIALGSCIGLAGYFRLGPEALAALALVIPFTVYGRAAYHVTGWSMASGCLLVRWGLFRTHLAIVPLGRIQAVLLHRSLVGTLTRMAEISVVVMGGSSVTVRYLSLTRARELQHTLAERLLTTDN